MSQNEYRRRRRGGRHIAYQCTRCTDGNQHGAAAVALEEIELQAEEEGLLGPAGPAAAPVDAPPPDEGRGQVLNIGVQELGLPAQPNPQPLPPPFRPRADRPFIVRLNASPPPVPPPAPIPVAEEDGPITFKYLEAGSKKRKPLFVGSDGYTFAFVSINMQYGSLLEICMILLLLEINYCFLIAICCD